MEAVIRATEHNRAHPPTQTGARVYCPKRGFTREKKADKLCLRALQGDAIRLGSIPLLFRAPASFSKRRFESAQSACIHFAMSGESSIEPGPPRMKAFSVIVSKLSRCDAKSNSACAPQRKEVLIAQPIKLCPLRFFVLLASDRTFSQSIQISPHATAAATAALCLSAKLCCALPRKAESEKLG